MIALHIDTNAMISYQPTPRHCDCSYVLAKPHESQTTLMQYKGRHRTNGSIIASKTTNDKCTARSESEQEEDLLYDELAKLRQIRP
jgi:hypothetical protein